MSTSSIYYFSIIVPELIIICSYKKHYSSRLRRKFESLNIESLLLDAGVETDQLMPKDEVSAKINLPPPVNASLTYVLCLLHYFDASYNHTCTLHICMDLQQLELLEESFCLINCLKIIINSHCISNNQRFRQYV